jgi:hypothetical protein
MEGKFAKTCTYALLIAILAAGVVAIATNNSFALAQPCQAQLASPNVSTQQYYYGANFQVTVPVSASCSFYQAMGQLYATGTAYDTTYNTNIGTANTVLTSTYGGYGYTGQLTFTLPASAQSHSVQFQVSIYGPQNGYYNGYYGGALLATASSTFVVGPSYYYPGYPTYPSYPSYPTPSYPSYPSYPYYPSYPSYSYYPSYHYYYPGYSCYYNHSYNGGYNNYCGPAYHNHWSPPHH